MIKFIDVLFGAPAPSRPAEGADEAAGGATSGGSGSGNTGGASNPDAGGAAPGPQQTQ